MRSKQPSAESFTGLLFESAKWRRRFGENPSVLKTTIRIHNAALVIIGVAGPGFRSETVGQNPDI
jgi:hypothetical protein